MPKKRDVPLQVEYPYQKNMRSGFRHDQLPRAAASGDKGSIQDCAGVVAVIVEKMPVRPDYVDLREWLTDALHQISSGTEPNIAFGWTQKGKRHGRREYRTIRKEWLIGKNMDDLLASSNPKLTPDAAGEIVGKIRKVAADTAVDLWKAYKKKG